jgi:hypothetical protein
MKNLATKIPEEPPKTGGEHSELLTKVRQSTNCDESTKCLTPPIDCRRLSRPSLRTRPDCIQD